MRIRVIEGDELDPVVEAWQVLTRLYEKARPITREESGLSEESWEEAPVSDWLVVPYVGFVDLDDMHPLRELEEYINRRVLERLEGAKSEG